MPDRQNENERESVLQEYDERTFLQDLWHTNSRQSRHAQLVANSQRLRTLAVGLQSWEGNGMLEHRFS